MRRRLIEILKGPFPALRRAEHLYMALIAVGIGLAGGLCAVGFRKLIQFFQSVAWRTDTVSLDYLRSLPDWWKVVVPAGGGLLVGLIVWHFAREAKGHGVPEVMEAVALRGGRIRPRVVIAKMVASGLCIASGGSVGREGPIVQIGSALGSSVGQFLGVGERRLRTLVGCGAAAGIAGTFNAPVAGALFAAEVILGDFAVAQFSPIVISSVASTVVSHYFLGDFPAFVIPKYSLGSPQELFVYVFLGILAGLVAVAFVRTLYAFEDLFDAVSIGLPVKAMAGGALIGLIGLRFPEIFGVGYEAIEYALHGELLWNFLLILAVVKILAVSITIGSGGSGGIFAPSLFIGAMLGGAVGAVANSLWPGATGHPGAYALVGMGAVVAATTHAPITAIVILFELTNDYKIILPLMITCITATLLATNIQQASIYTMKLLRRGVDLSVGQILSVLRNLRARDLMEEEFAVTVGPDEPLMAVVSRFVESPGGSVFVVDGSDRLLGVITINEVRPHTRDLATGDSSLLARDVMRTDGFPSVGPDDALDEVMRRFSNYRFPVPVLEDCMVVGAVRPQDVEERYNAEVFKRDMASKMSVATGGGGSRSIPGARGMSMADIAVPRKFVGSTLGELQIRKNYDVTILLIKHCTGEEEELDNRVPDADYVLGDCDRMLVMGRESNLRRLEKMSRRR